MAPVAYLDHIQSVVNSIQAEFSESKIKYIIIKKDYKQDLVYKVLSKHYTVLDLKQFCNDFKINFLIDVKNF